MKTVHGYGINDGKYPASAGSNIVKEYALWRGMLGRCYHRTENRKVAYKSYDGCKVSEFFKYYSNFYVWVRSQKGFLIENFDLDKDLLVKGNKIYSEDTCVFLPREINRTLQNNRSDRGEYPIGVRLHKQSGCFMSSMRKCNDFVYIGLYKTPEEAFLAYKVTKELYLKELANKWKDQIDPRAYDALMNYVVEDII